MTYKDKNPGKLSYLLGKYIPINYRSRIFYRHELDIKHQIGGNPHLLKFYSISGHIQKLKVAYSVLLDFILENIQLHSKSTIGI